MRRRLRRVAQAFIVRRARRVEEIHRVLVDAVASVSCGTSAMSRFVGGRSRRGDAMANFPTLQSGKTSRPSWRRVHS